MQTPVPMSTNSGNSGTYDTHAIELSIVNATAVNTTVAMNTMLTTRWNRRIPLLPAISLVLPVAEPDAGNARSGRGGGASRFLTGRGGTGNEAAATPGSSSTRVVDSGHLPFDALMTASANIKEIQMRTLIATAFVSLDGVVEAPGGEPGHRSAGWTFKDIEFDEAAYEIKGREQEEAAAMMMGRVSYEAFAPVWPTLDYFPQYNAMPKFVVSSTLEEDQLVDNWGDITILRSLDDVAALKETEGGPISVHGSATLNRNLSDAGLIDRYHLLVFPVLLGAGKRLFSQTDKDKQMLKVVESETYSNGIQKLVYDVVR